MALSVRKILEENPVQASAPCRIDSGGTWDIKTLALPLEKIEPLTINIALDLRTVVTLLPFDDGNVGVSSEGFSHREQYHHASLPFNSHFGLFFAAISHFDLHGLQVHIKSASPVNSALGGSSTALVALLKALSKLIEATGGKRLSGREILHLGYHLEDAVGGGKCGMQDQAAAVFGGVNKWNWNYGSFRSPFKRSPLMDASGLKALSKRILVSFSGKSHVSSRTNRIWVNDFLTGKTRAGWVEINEIVGRLASAFHEEDWEGAVEFIRAEMAIRRKITPDALTPLTDKMIKQADGVGCGARFAGAGAGGSVWALGEIDGVERLRKVWQGSLSPVKGACILDCDVDPTGVR